MKATITGVLNIIGARENRGKIERHIVTGIWLDGTLTRSSLMYTYMENARQKVPVKALYSAHNAADRREAVLLTLLNVIGHAPPL